MSWKVLLLDDNARSAEELHRGLTEVGCEVQVVTDKRMLAGVKSVARFSRDRFEAVLVSVQLPRLTGLHLFDRIHRDTRSRGTPIVLISSDTKMLARHEASSTPAEGYIRRPAEHEALVGELAAGLLAVVGAGTRTVPPPPPAAEETGSSAVDAAPVILEVTPPEGVPVDLSELTVPLPRLPVEGLRAPSDAGGRGSGGEPVRAPELEVELERSMGLLREAVSSLAQLGVAYQHFQRDQEVDRGRAATKLTAAAAAFDRKQRELVELREATTKQVAVLEKEFHVAHAAREQLERDRDAERGQHEAAAVVAQEKVRVLEEQLADERANAARAASAAEERVRVAEDATAQVQHDLLLTETAAAKKTEQLEDELRRSWAAHDEVAAQREQLRHALEVMQDEAQAAVETRDALRAEATRTQQELEARLEREVGLRRADQEVAVAALRSAEERLSSLEARTTPPPATGERISVTGSGELRLPSRSIPPPESQGRRIMSPSSDDARQRRSSGPPPFKSGSRMARVPASLDGDRDDTRPQGRSVLLIDHDRAARVSTARALARASCEVTVRDSCADVAAVIRTFDVVVIDVADVAIEQLVSVYRERPPACAIVVWTRDLQRARALFEGVSGVTFLEQSYRADELVSAVRAHLGRGADVANG